MTDNNQEQKPPTEEQQYLLKVVEKFNANPTDPELSRAEQTLLQKAGVVEKEASELAQTYVKLSNEIREKQEQMQALSQQITHKKGQSQGLVDSLLALRSNEDVSEEQQSA